MIPNDKSLITVHPSLPSAKIQDVTKWQMGKYGLQTSRTPGILSSCSWRVRDNSLDQMQYYLFSKFCVSCGVSSQVNMPGKPLKGGKTAAHFSHFIPWYNSLCHYSNLTASCDLVHRPTGKAVPCGTASLCINGPVQWPYYSWHCTNCLSISHSIFSLLMTKALVHINSLP